MLPPLGVVPELVTVLVAKVATLTAFTAVPPETLRLPHPVLSVCAKLVIKPAVVPVDCVNVVAGKFGGLAGVNLPRIAFNCAIASVTSVVLVKDTAFDTN